MAGRWTPFEYRVATRICETIFPSDADPDLPLGAADADVGDFIPRLVAVISGQVAFLLRLALWIVQFSPPFVGVAFRTFTSLDPDRREKTLHRLAEHRLYPLRELSMLWKAYGGMGYGGHPRVQAALGILTGPAEPAAPPVVGLGQRG